MKLLRKLKLVAVVLLLAVSGARAQSLEWQDLKPVGEEWGVVMPKDPVIETGQMPYHRMELNTRLYLSAPANGPVFAIVSMSGIKSNPAMYTEMQRMNSYVDAFKKFFAPRIKKEAVVKMSLVKHKKLNGHDGREYNLAIGDLSGPVETYVTRKRFYAIAFLTNKKADEIKERFISSFVLPEKIVEPPKPAVAEQPQKPDPPETEAKSKSGGHGAEGLTDPPPGKAETKPAEASDANGQANEKQEQPKEKKLLNGGVLNGKALILPTPYYPPDAKAAGAAGTVTVAILIDEYGNVVSATAVSGHPLLQQTAVNAAFTARFSPTLLMGEPVKVNGTLVYNFKL